MSDERDDYNVGDWICFLLNGSLVISAVKYITEGSLYITYITDAGPVHENDVLEARSTGRQPC